MKRFGVDKLDEANNDEPACATAMGFGRRILAQDGTTVRRATSLVFPVRSCCSWIRTARTSSLCQTNTALSFVQMFTVSNTRLTTSNAVTALPLRVAKQQQRTTHSRLRNVMEGRAHRMGICSRLGNFLVECRCELRYISSTSRGKESRRQDSN
jgi:hypothetical protein